MLFFNYLFIWLCGVLVWHAGPSLHHVESFAAAHRLVVTCGLGSWGVWALEHVASVLVAHGLDCSVACGILVPELRIGSNPEPGFKLVSFAL